MAKDKEIRNIVDFPKDRRSYSHEKLDDPLEELLNEFHDYEQELQDEYEKDQQSFQEFSREEYVLPESDLIEEQLKTLEEVRQRLQFYWKEIDIYLNSK